MFLGCGESDYFPEMREECMRPHCGQTTCRPLVPWVRTHVQTVPVWLRAARPSAVSAQLVGNPGSG